LQGVEEEDVLVRGYLEEAQASTEGVHRIRLHVHGQLPGLPELPGGLLGSWDIDDILRTLWEGRHGGGQASGAGVYV
jgi:hypothetical protein